MVHLNIIESNTKNDSVLKMMDISHANKQYPYISHVNIINYNLLKALHFAHSTVLLFIWKARVFMRLLERLK